MDCVRGQEYEAALGIEVWSQFCRSGIVSGPQLPYATQLGVMTACDHGGSLSFTGIY